MNDMVMKARDIAAKRRAAAGLPPLDPDEAMRPKPFVTALVDAGVTPDRALDLALGFVDGRDPHTVPVLGTDAARTFVATSFKAFAAAQDVR